MRNLLIIVSLLFTLPIFAQQELRIALIHDSEEVEEGVLNDFQKNLKEEIKLLLQVKRTIIFKDYFGNHQAATITTKVKEAYTNNDILITIGTIGSQLVSLQKSFPKPTIASIITDTELSGLQLTDDKTSGIPNFTFVESPFDIIRDLQTLYAIQPFKNLAVITDKETNADGGAILSKLIKNNLADLSIQPTFYDNKELVAGTTTLPATVDAAYVLPIFGKTATTQINSIFELINTQRIPSIALFGKEYVNSGALAAYESEKNLQLIPRRIALNVLKISEGKAAKDIPVSIKTYNNNLLINMAIARKIGIYPNFNLMATATLINLIDTNRDRQLTLQSAIAEGLRSNLELQLSALDVSVANKEVGIANSDRLPQVDVSTQLSVVDDFTVMSSFGSQGKINWVAAANVSQVIYSEPLLANIAIQKLLEEGANYELERTQLDIIVEVATAYLNILQAQTNLSIQLKTVEVTKENYSISKSKNAIGYTGPADLYRWEAELATQNISLNVAYASVKQAKFRLNQLLNRPVDEPFSVSKEKVEDQLLLTSDGRLQLISDLGMVEKFTAFIVDFSKDKLPTLDIIDNNIEVQERQQLSQERAFYLPTIAASGGANRVLGKYRIPETVTAIDNSTTWNLGISLQYPIFQGGLRKRQVEKSELLLNQLDLTRQNVHNQLELAIRSNMQDIYVSYSRMDLSKIAATAAEKNFQIVQDSYNQGQVNITTLIDAQNNTLQAELSANNAVYNFILDFMELERSIGFFYFLASDAERNDFFQQVNEYLVRK